MATQNATADTQNATAVRKTLKALTDQKTLSRIFSGCDHINLLTFGETDDDCGDEVSDLSNAILENPSGRGLVDWFVASAEGSTLEDYEVAYVLAQLITAARMPSTCKWRSLAEEKPAKEDAKKFVPPPAKLLIFNLAGKAVEDIDFYDDVAYLVKKRGWYDPAICDTKLVPGMQMLDWVLDWRARNVGKSEKEENSAFNALWISPNRPRWVDRLKKADQENSTKPTPPAA
jgi:hypothetical protein